MKVVCGEEKTSSVRKEETNGNGGDGGVCRFLVDARYDVLLDIWLFKWRSDKVHHFMRKFDRYYVSGGGLMVEE